MSFLKQKESFTQNITFMALMAIINVAFALLIAFTSLIAAILIIILPLVNTIVAYFTKARYYPLYIVATILLCIVTTLWNIDSTIYYVLPALISGFVFGVFARKKISPYFSIALCAFINLGFTYLSLGILKLVYDVDFINVILSFLNSDNEVLLPYVPLIILLISFIQIGLSFLIIHEEFKKIDPSLFSIKQMRIIEKVIDLVTLLIFIVTAFFYSPIAFLTIVLFLYFAFYSLTRAITRKQTLEIVLYLVSLIPSSITYALLYPSLKSDNPLLLIMIFPLLIEVISFLFVLLKKERKNDTIKKQKEE